MNGTNLYHLGIDASRIDFAKEFGDVKFVCIGGSSLRAKNFAQRLAKTFYDREDDLPNISEATDRYVMYKTGSILVLNHGIGMASLSVMLLELFKLLEFAQCKDPLIIRIGTCGGLGINPGTVIITNKAFDGYLQDYFEMAVLGKKIQVVPEFDSEAINELLECGGVEDDFEIYEGATMTTDDFYYAQGRTDGPLQLYTKEESDKFLKSLSAYGIRNIEMESCALGALCGLAKIRNVVVCSSLVDRYQDSQIYKSKDDLSKCYENGYTVVMRFLSKRLNL